MAISGKNINIRLRIGDKILIGKVEDSFHVNDMKPDKGVIYIKFNSVALISKIYIN